MKELIRKGVVVKKHYSAFRITGILRESGDHWILDLEKTNLDFLCFYDQQITERSGNIITLKNS